MSKNPLTYGFGAIRRDPALLLTEVLWRWCVGAMALLLVRGFLVLYSAGNLTDGNDIGWRSYNPLVIAQAVVHLVGGLDDGLLKVAIALLLVVTVLWTLLGAIGRTFTLNRLERSGVQFRSILALQSLRAVALWLAGIALTKTIVLDARLSGRGAKSDLFLYSALAVWSVILIGVLWAAVNWNLSLAAVCCAKNAGGFGRSIRQALALDRSHSGDLLGVSLVFALWRLIFLAIAFVLWFLPSVKMAAAPRAYFAWFVATMLAYLAASDYLYIARMAGYLAIDPLDSNGDQVGTSRPGLPGSEPIAL